MKRGSSTPEMYEYQPKGLAAIGVRPSTELHASY